MKRQGGRLETDLYKKKGSRMKFDYANVRLVLIEKKLSTMFYATEQRLVQTSGAM